MGQASSAYDLQEAVEEVEASAPEGGVTHGIKLYKFVTAGSSGQYELVTANAKYTFYDANEGSRKKSDWFLEIGDLDVHIDQHIDFIIAPEQKRITFSADGTIFALKFTSPTAFKSFCEELNDKLFANTFKAENDDKNREKHLGDYSDIFFDANLNFTPMEADGQDPAPPPDVPDVEDRQAMETDEDTIHGIVMGAFDNGFVIRGTQFDVIRNLPGGGVEDKGLSFAIAPPRGGAAFTPTRVLLTQQERRMNLLTPDNSNLLHHVDIETQKIVQTLNFQKDQVDIPIMDITHINKSSQLTDEKTFLGLDKNRLVKWDLRDPNGVVQESPVVDYVGGKDYSRGTNFTCMATSGDGYVAVGSVDGTVRMYSDKTLTRATTNLPSLGVPITSIDVTFDGKWVLATTDHHLMLVKTTVTDENGHTGIGFKQRLGKRMAVPRLLRLLPEDQARVAHKPLTKGKFQWVTESGQPECWIVASVGKFSVIWNFSQVKRGVSESVAMAGLPVNTQYYLRAKDEDVVESTFMHHNYAQNTASGEAQTPLVVATHHGLFAVGS